MMKYKESSDSDSEAVFIGWQEMFSGGLIALYNVIAPNHPLYGSTVTEKTLHELKLQIPDQSRSRSNQKNLKNPE